MRAARFHPGEAGDRDGTATRTRPREVLVDLEDVPATLHRLEHGELTGLAVVVP